MIEIRPRLLGKRPRVEVADADRASVIHAMAAALSRARLEYERAERMLQDAAKAGPGELAAMQALVSEIAGGATVEPPATLNGPTFRKIGEEWTSGDLHERFPDQVPTIFQEFNIQRLEKHIYPVLGTKPVARVTRGDCDEVMRRLPESIKSRRHIAVIVSRVLNLAALAGYIDRSPLPRGWLPRPNARKLFPILYPKEDATLLGRKPIPLPIRVLYGVAHREGLRRGELAALRWRDLDLAHGTITLTENKTDHARLWKLGDGVASALDTWRKQRQATADDPKRDDSADLVFIDENGGPLDLDNFADRVRDHLRAAELDRADLYSTGPLKRPFGTHCFRRSFVTRSLALGRNEDWVRQRTGHTSDELLKYRQAARAFADLDLGELTPLDQAIPELAPPTPPGTPRDSKPPGAKVDPAVDPEWSGRPDSNRRPLDPQSSALTRLRYAPIRPSPERARASDRAEPSRFRSECKDDRPNPAVR